MIFGQKVSYVYGEVFKDKFSTPTKAYKIEPLQLECQECPARIVDGKIEIFFSGPIFNTYVSSIEDNVSLLKSYDEKLTIFKGKLNKGVLYTVKIVSEKEKVREVEIYDFSELFPGYRSKGIVELMNNETFINTPKCRGPIILQNNSNKAETECILFLIEDNEYKFVEINNPVERCHVKVVKDLKGNKLVENGNIKGILLNVSSSKQEYDVYAKKACLGNYVFVEDIKEGKATVELVGKKNGVFEVKYKGFTGACVDKKVSRVMKGRIYDIKGSSFKFKREEDDEHVEERTDDFERVEVVKRIKIESEDQIQNDQHRAIEFLKSKGKDENIIPLFNKLMKEIPEKDDLCLFYLLHLREKKMLSADDVNDMIKIASPSFCYKLVDNFSEKEVLEIAFKKKKTKKCFEKLLGLTENKTKLMKENPLFADLSISYSYKHMDNPRVVVEKFIDNSYSSWMVYLSNEKGDYKRGLFRRMIKMKFKPEEMKKIFKSWLEFEEKNSGNTNEVRKLAEEYVRDHEKK